jgi:hypothetical protein
MARDNEHNPDPNVNAARIVGETIEADASDIGGGKADPAIEAAWRAWSGCIQNVDERARTLLRAAFEAGWDAGPR